MKDKSCSKCIHGGVCAWRMKIAKNTDELWNGIYDDRNGPTPIDAKILDAMDDELMNALDDILGKRCKFFYPDA